MKVFQVILLMLVPLWVRADSTVTFDATGDFGSSANSANFNFSSALAPWLAEAAGVGVGGSRALALAGSGADVSFTHKSAGSGVDLSKLNATAEVSLFFRKNAATTANSSRVLDLGLVPGDDFYTFQGRHAQVRLRTTGTHTVTLQFWNANADVGSGFAGTLTAGCFYRLTFKATNLDGSRVKLEAWLDDYGTVGTALVTPLVVYGSGTYVNQVLPNCPDLHAGFRLRNENGSNAVGVVDQLAITSTAGSGTLPARIFVHPGLLNSEAEMLYWSVRAGIGAQPQGVGLARVLSGLDDTGAPFLDHLPQAAVTWTAATHWSSPGPARRLLDDARAAYACALLWRATGNAAYAAKATQILDAWSGTLTTILNAQGVPSNNADTAGLDYQLYSSYSWPAMIWTAEILRHTPGSGWSLAGRNAFEALLVNVLRPAIEHPANEIANNWRSWRICFKTACAIYLDDTPRFEQALEEFSFHTFAYIKDNLTGEISRDMWHSQMGIIPLILTAEMALKQGVDLYSHKNNMLFRCLEFQLPYFVSGLTYPPEVQWDGSKLWSMFEFSYHHYHRRCHVAAPEHEALFNHAGLLVMPSVPSPASAPNVARPYRAEDFYRTGYGTLTHSGDPLDYAILAGFDLAQNPATDMGLTLDASGGTIQQVADPSPQHPSNGVIAMTHLTGSATSLSRVVTLADRLSIGFDYRFAGSGTLTVVVGGQIVDVITAPSAGPGRDSFAQYRRSLTLASLGLPSGNHSVALQAGGMGATPVYLDNWIVTTPRNTNGVPLQPYMLWIEDHPSLRGPDALPAGGAARDSFPNLVKYGLDLDPAAAVNIGLPTSSLQAGRLALAFTVHAGRKDLIYTVQSSPDLVSWTDIARSVSGGPTTSLNLGCFSVSDSGAGVRKATVTDAHTGDQGRFLRLFLSLY